MCLYTICTYNKLVKMRIQVDEAFSTMDVYLKKRYDLIPNIVATVKGYAKHEKETLDAVIKARNLAVAATDTNEKVQANNQISTALRGLFAIAESYPELKANANFLSLQNDLKSIENEIANSRKYYNAVVRDYNVKCQSFPANIIAKIFKFKTRELYEIDSPEERKNVKVEF